MEKKVGIDPWGSGAVTDYEHVFKEFGLNAFPEKMKKELDHYFFKRNIIIAHRDFQPIFESIQKRKKFINITGIASSGQFHLGHKVDIDLFKFFKDKGANNYFCICDLDAYVSRPDSKIPSLQKAQEFAISNTADALALGLEPEDIKVQSKREQRYYSFAFELSKKITANTFEAIYGHIDLGKVSANFLQYADILHGQLPEYNGPMPSITGIGLDQDPHARAVRDIAKRLSYKMHSPSFIYFKHQSGLKEGAKMSSSEPDTAIFLNDSPKEIERKIKNAFTGGRNTAEEHRRLGGILEVDKVFELLLFHYPDDKKLEQIAEDFTSGKMLSGEMKQIAIEFFKKNLEAHQAKAEANKKLAEEIVLGK